MSVSQKLVQGQNSPTGGSAGEGSLTLYEFIYASAPATLEGPGYGAVAKTENFPDELDKFCRQQCRYDFLSKDFGPGAIPYPKVHSHTIFRQGAVEWHVLSRTVFAGKDYTQRYVFLTHIVAVKSAELQQTPISALMRQANLFQGTWDGPPRRLPPKVLNIQSLKPKGPAQSWQQYAGDQQWAEVFAQRSQTSPVEPRFLVFSGDVEPLPFYLEAMDSLPVAQANQITFLTHLATDQRGPTYHWIGLIANTELALSVEKNSRERVTNLTRPLGSATQIVEELRQAEAIRREKAAPKKPVPRPSEDDPNSSDYIPEEYRGSKFPSKPAATNLNPENLQSGYRLQTPASPASSNPKPKADLLPDIPAPRPADANNLMKYLAMAGIVTVLGIGTVVWMNRQSGAKSESSVASQEQQEGSRPAAKDSPNQLANASGATSPDGEAPRDPPGKSKLPPIIEKVPEVRVVKPRVESLKFVTRGLNEAMEEKDSQPSPLIESVNEFSRPDLQVKLLSDLGLKGSTTRMDTQSPRAAANDQLLDVKITDESVPDAALHLQIGSGAVRLLSGSAKSRTRVLLNRLRFAVLDIASSVFDDADPFVIHLALNPKLSGIPTSGVTFSSETFKPTESQKADLNDVLQMIAEQQKASQPIDCFLRVNRITLSILPESDPGWLVADGRSVISDFNAPLHDEIRIHHPGTSSVGEFRLETHFDRENMTTQPAIAAELHFNPRNGQTPGDVAGSTQKVDVNPLKSGSDSDAAKASTTEEKPETPEKPSAKPKNKKTVKTPKGISKTEPNLESTVPEAGVEKPSLSEQLSKISDGVFLDELFRRYGRVHAEIVVRIRGGIEPSPPRGQVDPGAKRIESEKISEETRPREYVILRWGE